MHFEEYNEGIQNTFLKNKRKNIRPSNILATQLNDETNREKQQIKSGYVKATEILNKKLAYLSDNEFFNIRNKVGEQIVINFDDDIIQDDSLNDKINQIKNLKDKKKSIEYKEEIYDPDFIETKTQDTGKLIKGNYFKN
jgi:hypothetical protein